LCGPIAAPPCTLPKEHSKTRTQDSLWRGGMLAVFFGPVAAPPCTLPNKSIQRQGHTTALGGGMLVIFFWTISAANPDRTMRSARPPLFVTLFDTLLGRFWRFLGSFWRPERGLGPTWGYLGISKVKVCTPSLHFEGFCLQTGTPLGTQKSHWVPPGGHRSSQ